MKHQLLLALLIVLPMAEVVDAEDVAYDPLQTALALNYCQVSLANVISYNDKIILDQEYDNIINNINLSRVKDEEIVSLFMDLMDALTKSRLQVGDKQWLQRAYEKQMENAIYSAVGRSGITVVSGNPLVLAGQAVFSVGMSYFNYQKNIAQYKEALEKSKWELKKEELEYLNYIRKSFFEASWRLIQKYNFPDEWRLSEKQINEYIDILKDTDSERKFRKLRRIEDSFQAYPPFWYYFGKTAQDIQNTAYALECYKIFETKQKGIFRCDPYYASVCMNRITLYDTNKDVTFIQSDISTLLKNSAGNHEMILFAALTYGKLKQYAMAQELLTQNIDDQYEESLHRRFLGDILIDQGKTSELAMWMQKMCDSDTAKNQDVLYLVGRAKEYDKVKMLAPQIMPITISLSQNWISPDDVIVSLPVKWFLDSLAVTLQIDGESLSPARLEKKEQVGTICCIFDAGFDRQKFFESGKSAGFRLQLDHPSCVVVLNFSADIQKRVEKKSQVEAWVDKKKILFGVWIDPKKDKSVSDTKTISEASFTLTSIETLGKVFPIRNGVICEK